ncbi:MULTISPECIES: helix-turn-helix domain-containing protein [Staphylococcus]|uniref:helix-turn-helix domain-containing protein n=1 Tax=Staphylococcus TaxID=1279 RepID=UPI0008A9FC84|nr:helix-turn-helix domain-containing protein [Staphylococcus sp. HMSC077D08]OHQ96784.1 XRE family transcriptional regulator [Staphylococcus sp. HMSC077D08]
MKFSEILKQYRTKENLSINKLAKLSGVSTTYISKLENNNRSYPTIETIFNLTLGLILKIKEKYKDIENYDDYLYPEIEKIISDFATSEDSNLDKETKNTIIDDFIKYMERKENEFLNKSFSDNREIFENKIAMNTNTMDYKKIEYPYFDLKWLLSQNKFEVFYGRDFITDLATIEDNKLNTKSMYFYNILDKEDLKTIQKLIEVYLESKYPKIKDKDDFFILATDKQNRIKNAVDWYNID